MVGVKSADDIVEAGVKGVIKNGSEEVVERAGKIATGVKSTINKGTANSESKTFRDLMSPEEANRYDDYWRQGAGSYDNKKLSDGTKKEVIKGWKNKLSTRQRLQMPPGTRSIMDIKYRDGIPGLHPNTPKRR